MTNYVATLVHLVPNAKLSYTGLDPDYDAIGWADDRPKPSRQECDDAWPGLEVELADTAAKAGRAAAYRNEADPLFFGWQRNENEEQDWLDKVAEIRTRFPYSGD
jgi:hypothetical protein